MDQETITTEAPGIDSGADTSAGITTEAELANSFLERVEEQPEEKPTETEATDDSDAEAEEDSEANVLSQSEQSEETETAEYEEAASRYCRCASAGARAKGQGVGLPRSWPRVWSRNVCFQHSPLQSHD
jgi:hypothetical protein